MEMVKAQLSTTKPLSEKEFGISMFPLKFRIFAWRACRNGLPTMLNLRCRGLNSCGFCPLCDKEMESLQHAFLLCSHAKHTWASQLDCLVNLSITGANIVDLVAHFNGEGKLSELDLFFMVAWSIWGNKNQAIHNDVANPPSQVWESTRRALLDYNASCLNPLPTHPPTRYHWAAPPPGFHKINVDGATDDGGGNSCVGVIIRDPLGATIGALSKLLPSCLHAEVSEAFALHRGVHFALEMQIDHAIFESEALPIILALSSGEAGGDLGHILEDIRTASSSLSQCFFHHLKRDDNRVAHTLAREAKISGQTKIWIGTSPPCIPQILRDDLL